MLEELEHALRRGRETFYGELHGYGMSGDAYHVTAGHEDGQGARRAMADAIRQAEDGDEAVLRDLWCVNAHATSTPKGDLAEMRALQWLLSNSTSRPHVVSNKGSIGHLLGAAGSVESAFALLSLRDGIVPKNLNVQDGSLDSSLPLGECIVRENNLAVQLDPRKRHYVLKNSFGFGGTNVSLLFSNFVP